MEYQGIYNLGLRNVTLNLAHQSTLLRGEKQTYRSYICDSGILVNKAFNAFTYNQHKYIIYSISSPVIQCTVALGKGGLALAANQALLHKCLYQ